MQPVNFDQSVNQIVADDPRFRPEAYFFMRDALEYTKRSLSRSKTDQKHVSGKELLEGIRAFSLETYGPMTITVLEEWGIHSCGDFGEIVFNMIEYNLLAKSDTDTRADFHDGYAFADAFRKPFLPSARLVSPPKSVEV
jgi:uncharacterized repeat protein (TIGR04138 family)